MRLTIINVQSSDYGNYKCVAKNPRGDTDGNIKLYSECYLYPLIWGHSHRHSQSESDSM